MEEALRVRGGKVRRRLFRRGWPMVLVWVGSRQAPPWMKLQGG